MRSCRAKGLQIYEEFFVIQNTIKHLSEILELFDIFVAYLAVARRLTILAVRILAAELLTFCHLFPALSAQKLSVRASGLSVETRVCVFDNIADYDTRPG